jgi:glycosyltransferase involved in cell wall biosynthesis
VSVTEVSVIIPTRDRCERLRLALRSALAQRDVDLEVIVVDDASSDGSGAMIEALGEARVRFVRNDAPLGESGARNRGIVRARGTWIAFLDDDDLWAPDKLALQIEALRTSGRQWAYAGHVVIDPELRVLHGSPPPAAEVVAASLVRHNAVPGSASSVVVAAEVLDRVGPFDAELRRTPDWDMWLRLVRVGLPVSVHKPLVAVCLHGGNLSRDMDLLFRELNVIAARYRISVDRAAHYRWAAWYALLEGRRVDAIRYHGRAVVAGDFRSLARAAAVLLGPGYAIRRARNKDPAGQLNPWIAEARRWLDPLARAEGSPREQR